MRTLIPRLSSLGGITRLVYLQMRGFSSFPQFWLLRCTWERWTILLQYGSWDWGHFLLLSCWILYICMWDPGFCTSTQGLHWQTSSLLPSWARVFDILSLTLSLPSHIKNDILSSSSYRRVQSRSGEGRVNERHMDWITQWIHR